MNIIVLGGGDSPEREVSLRSAKAVADGARQAGFEVMEKDPAKGLGFLDDLPIETIVLPILHGKNGEDGVIQAELEKRHLPYLGSDSVSSANCFDKWKTLKTISKAGIPIAKSALVTKQTFANNELAHKPYVLKVVHGGSSIGTLIVRNTQNVRHEEIEKVFELDKEVLLEELVEGIEITIPILDKQALPVIEIRPPEGLEFDYENKYNGLTAEICPPESVDGKLQAAAQALAEKAHNAIGCRHLSRVDIIARPGGQMVFLEINTIPGLTDQSLYPKSAAVAGLQMPDLVKRFVKMVQRDYSMMES